MNLSFGKLSNTIVCARAIYVRFKRNICQKVNIYKYLLYLSMSTPEQKKSLINQEESRKKTEKEKHILKQIKIY